MSTKEVMTFKSGKFCFCDQYDKSKMEKWLVEASVLIATIRDIPLLPKWSSQIDPELLYSSIAGTAAIEGNAISEQDVRVIAAGKTPETEYSRKDQIEIKNLLSAYQLTDSIPSAQQPFTLTEELIRELHRLITSGIPYENNIPGTYRNGKVVVGDKSHGGIYTPPKIIEDVDMLMKAFIEWINSEEIISLPALVRSALAHYHLGLIHPFWDGNGRVARLTEALLLQDAGIRYVPRSLSNYYSRHVDDYYIAFSKSTKAEHDVTPFLEFTLNGVINSLIKMKTRLSFFIRELVMRDHIHFLGTNKTISKRQCDLLNILLDKRGAPFSLNELSRTMPYSILYKRISLQTARRDLKKLSEMNLLSSDDSGKYMLNMHALDQQER
ncbi:MAG: Fic family protein [Chlorobium sp.]